MKNRDTPKHAIGLFALSVLLMVLVACAGELEPTSLPQEEGVTAETQPTESPTKPPSRSLETTRELAESAAEPLPADLQEIEFEAQDGQLLHGTYYPAGVNPAPVIVLMHWAPGDHYQSFQFAGRSHGMKLIDPDVEPNVLSLMLDFIRISL
jgi:hypothetical protein